MTQQIHNPYNLGVITKPNQFFNRKMLVEKVLDSLFSDSAQCQSIVGQMMIGKSSFIKHLSEPATIAQFGYEGSKHLFVNISCARNPRALRSSEDFYRVLLRGLHAEMVKTLPDAATAYAVNLVNPTSWQDEWESVLHALVSNHFYIIVILDEFDKAILQGNLHKDGLFESLRAYGSGFSHFAWITCTLQPLPKLFDRAFRTFGISNEERMSFSDFYNIVSGSYIVGLFDQDDIDELITSPSKAEQISFSREEQRTIRTFGGRFPYFVQRACYHFFEARRKAIMKHEDILQDCLRDAQNIWADYWDKLTSQQQRVLFTIASGHPVEVSSDIRSLEDAALIYKEHGHWFPFSEEFGRFIRSREHPYEGFPVNPGERLWKQYEVEEIAGRTLHSQVVKAQDIYLKRRHWAIKLLCINQDQTDERVKEFHRNLLREAQILDLLAHKNIGQVHDVRLDPLGVIMPWIEGQSLGSILQDHIALPVTTVIKIGMQLADALRYAHTKGIVHRDIKPLNIILKPNGEPILIDFGIARSKDHQTITYSESGSPLQIGTLPYSAPEQFGPPELVGSPADIFALGAVLYELLTFERPYPHGNNPKHYAGQLPVPEPQNIPYIFYHLLCKLLCQQPEQRPSAVDVYEELQACFMISEANNETAIEP